MTELAENTLRTAIDAARLAQPTVATFDTELWVAVPKTHEVRKIDIPGALLADINATVMVDDKQSLVVYTNRFASPHSILLADFDKLTIRAALDWHDHEVGDARHTQHNCHLVLRPSEQFSRWNKMQGRLVPQAEFAAFLEENAEDIWTPEPAVMIELSRDMEGTVGQTFKSANRLQSGDREFVFQTETRVSGRLIVPTEFTISIPLWQGEEPTVLRCAFRYRVADGELLMGFEWRRVEYQRIGHFHQIATEVAEATGLPVIYGRVA